MISLPNDLLERLDSRARETKETRSGLLRRLIERELKANETLRRKQLEDLLGPPVPMGGDWARLIREDRESH